MGCLMFDMPAVDNSDLNEPIGLIQYDFVLSFLDFVLFSSFGCFYPSKHKCQRTNLASHRILSKNNHYCGRPTLGPSRQVLIL